MINFPYRYIARIVIMAKTAISVGSDSLLLEQDNPVERDFNGLPVIPGTAITGFLTRKLNAKNFGKTDVEVDENTIGSNIIISDALLYTNGMVHQQVDDLSQNPFLKNYWQLPIRPHAAHTHKGVAKDGAFFDNEIVYKGSQFKFEISLEMTAQSDDFWKETLEALCGNDFYLGAGQFNGMGQMEVLEIVEKKCNLEQPDELADYLENYSVDMNKGSFDKFPFSIDKTKIAELTIPFDCRDSFFHFGSGFGDAEVDDTNYKEAIAPTFEEQNMIPGTSIKGVLAHRTAYYSNIEQGNTIEKMLGEVMIDSLDIEQLVLPDNLEELIEIEKSLQEKLDALEKAEKDIFEKYTGSNITIEELFGKAKKSKDETGKAGKIIIPDVYLPLNTTEEIFHHNKIDRYTGGTIDSALFAEKVLAIDYFDLVIKGDIGSIENPNLQKAIDDMKAGRLAIGGKTNKGHGILKLKAG